MDPIYVIGQIIGVVAVLLTFVSYQVKSQKLLLLLQTASTALFCVHYFMIGAPSGLALNILCIVRNIIYFFRHTKFFSLDLWPILLSSLMPILGGLSWEGYHSLFIIVALVVNTLFLASPDPQIIRISVVFTCSLILVYNCFSLSIGGMINESVAIGSSLIDIVLHLRRAPKKTA